MSKDASSTNDNNNNSKKSSNDTLLLQRSDVINSFLHQNVIVGVAQNNFTSTVGVEGRLDAVDTMSNVVLANATSPSLLGQNQQQQPSKVAAVRGASVLFFGIPKKQQVNQD